MQIFIPVEVLDQLGLVPLATLIAFYGYILYMASKLLSKGSSMLLAIYGPGIIGGFLIPILGAVPDSIMILISGMGTGSADDIQRQLAIGVGTLAGSTIMLITIPWAVGVYLGRRDIDGSGRALTETVDGNVVARYSRFTWTKTGVVVFPEINFLARSMMITSLLYLIIQIPALYYHSDPNAAAKERIFAATGFFASVIAFVFYSWVQLRSDEGQEIVKQMQKTRQQQHWRDLLIEKFPPGKSIKLIFRSLDLNGDNNLDKAELKKCLENLGLNADDHEVIAVLKEMDIGDDDDGCGAGDERISFQEFERFFSRAIGLPFSHLHRSNSVVDVLAAHQSMPMAAGLDIRLMMNDNPNNGEWDKECDELDDNGSDEITDDNIQKEAFRVLALGAIVVTLFSFPMVDTIEVFASKIGVDAFYISFVVTPLASNASEVIAALQFASKRNTKGVSLMFGTLYGAANMNNTFTLSIFLGIVAVRGLTWNFTAECLAILLVTLIVGLQGIKRTVHMWQAALVLALYPASIALLWILNSISL